MTGRLIFSLLALFLLSGCNNTPKQPSFSFPALPDDQRAILMQQCDMVDVIMYELPISMNQEDRYSIQRTIGFASPEQIIHNPACKPIGRMNFLGKGKTLAEADLYFGPDCQYFVFVENNKPVYGNLMSETGIKFYNNVIQTTRQQQQQMQGQ